MQPGTMIEKFGLTWTLEQRMAYKQKYIYIYTWYYYVFQSPCEVILSKKRRPWAEGTLPNDALIVIDDTAYQSDSSSSNMIISIVEFLLILSKISCWKFSKRGQSYTLMRRV